MLLAKPVSVVDAPIKSEHDVGGTTRRQEHLSPLPPIARLDNIRPKVYDTAIVNNVALLPSICLPSEKGFSAGKAQGLTVRLGPKSYQRPTDYVTSPKKAAFPNTNKRILLPAPAFTVREPNSQLSPSAVCAGGLFYTQTNHHTGGKS